MDNKIQGFTVEEIIRMQEIVSQRIGGALGVQSMDQLESSAEAPFTDYFGVELFPSIIDKAARYATAFDQKQIFLDGNKRVSVSVMLGWLARNGFCCTLSNYALHEMMMDLANKTIAETEDLAEILKNCTEPTTQFEGIDLEAIMKAILDTYEQTYIMLGAGAGDPKIDEWKEAMRASGDNGNYRLGI